MSLVPGGWENDPQDLLSAKMAEDGCDELWDSTVGESLYDMLQYWGPLYEYRAKMSDKGDLRMALTRLYGLLTLLEDSRLNWLSLDPSELPPYNDICMMFGLRAIKDKDLTGVTEIKLPKWSGVMRTWFPYALKVKSKMSGLGLDALIAPLPDDKNSAQYKTLQYKRMALVKYDSMFFHALEESIAHKDSKMPRVDLINFARWHGAPHRGSIIWEYCLSLMENKHVVEDRQMYYENALSGCLLEAKEEVYADAPAFNTAAIKLSYRALVNNETDPKKADADFLAS